MVLLLKGLGLMRLRFQVSVDLRLIGMVISEGRMNLRQRTGGQTSARSPPESDPCCATERFGERRPPSPQYTAAGRGCQGVERSGCLSRSHWQEPVRNRGGSQSAAKPVHDNLERIRARLS